MHRLRVIICSLLFLCSFDSFPQEKGTGPREKTVKEEIKSNKRIRQEKREKRKREKAEKKAIKKHHKRIQTKTVRKRMSSSKKRAKRNNDNTREFFLVRWYKKVFK